MAEFDTVSKDLIQTYPEDFVRFSLGQDDVEVIDVINTELPTVEAHHADSFIRVRIGGEEALVHSEFQTTDSTKPPMSHRMAGYIGLGIKHHGLPIYSNVIYLRPDAGQRDPGHYIQERLGYRVFIQYKVIRLIEIEGQRILNARYSGLIPFAPLMKPPEGMAAEDWLRQCVQTADELPMRGSAKANFLTDLAILSGLVYESQTIFNIISEETMYESSIVQHFTERGIEQGIEKGIQESIQEVLEIRFHSQAAQSTAARIEAIDDLQRLKQLHREAIQVSSFEEFRHLLDAI